MKWLPILLSLTMTAKAANYYAATNGSAGGTGATNDPLTLVKAIGGTSPAVAGDTIYLRGGTYTNQDGFTSDLAGSSGNPITVCPYPNERPIIDGNYNGTGGSGVTFAIRGSWTIYRDFEVMNSYTNRDSVSGRAAGVDIGGNAGGCHDVKCINLIVHDVGNAMGMWKDSTNSEISGCLIYNNGYEDVSPDRGHGHAIYAQNQYGIASFFDNIIINTFDVGFHAYSENAALKNMRVGGNVCANSGATDRTTNHVANMLFGGNNPGTNIVATNNFCYQPQGPNQGSGYAENFIAGYDIYENNDIIISNNYLGNGMLKILAWTNMVVASNTIISPDSGVVAAAVAPGLGTNSWYWDYNYYNVTKSQPFGFGADYSFANWKTATGFDAHSTYSSTAPTTTNIFISANRYQSKRATIIAYNWGLSNNIVIDPTGILSSGDTYIVRDCANYFGTAVKSGTWTSGTITLPMTNLLAATPIGRANPPPATGPEFNVFDVQGIAGSSTNITQMGVVTIQKLIVNQ